jgi:hypothetical protein
MTYKKTHSQKNPYKLTINQHTFPRASINRFSKNGKVYVHLKEENKLVILSLDNKLFCAQRLWNESLEHGLMFRIEGEFQRLVDKVLKDYMDLSTEDHAKISKFWALWKIRSETKFSPALDISFLGLPNHQELSKNEEDALEKNGYIYMKEDTLQSRHVNSIGIQLQLTVCSEQIIAKGTKWGLIYSPNIEFIVPDTFNKIGIVPVSPNFCFVANTKSGSITNSNAIAINKNAINNAKKYYFSQDFSKTGI